MAPQFIFVSFHALSWSKTNGNRIQTWDNFKIASHIIFLVIINKDDYLSGNFRDWFPVRGLPIHFNEEGGGWWGESQCTNKPPVTDAKKQTNLEFQRCLNASIPRNGTQFSSEHMHPDSGGPAGTILGLFTLPGPHSWSMYTGHSGSQRKPS